MASQRQRKHLLTQSSLSPKYVFFHLRPLQSGACSLAMEKLFRMELCEPPVPDLGALIEALESRVLLFCGSDAVKHVDGVADRQTVYPPCTPTTQNRGRSRHERERRREEEGGSVDDERRSGMFFGLFWYLQSRCSNFVSQDGRQVFCKSSSLNAAVLFLT